MRPGRESNPRMAVLQTAALTASPPGQLHYSITIYPLFKPYGLWNTYSKFTPCMSTIKKRKRSWTDAELTAAVKTSSSIRAVLIKIGLVPAGGNYRQVSESIKELGLDTKHFTGMGWRKNRTFDFIPQRALKDILVKHSDFQSFKLKKRLFVEGLKTPKCELCDWAEVAQDGRIPVELDHINGDRFDNRLENLRILCPNCHSLQPTHRGLPISPPWLLLI